MARVRFTATANRDLARLAEYIEANGGHRAAATWVREVQAQVSLLAANPRLGQSDKRLGGRRRLVVGAYLVIYEVNEAGMVQIVRVVHGARDVPSLFSRPQDE